MLDSSERLDIIVTAGDRGASRPVFGKNKAFLLIDGAPVITHVLSAAERARCTARVFVIGNKAHIEKALAHPQSPFRGRCPLHVLEQYNTLYENVWNAFLFTLPGYTPETAWQVYADTTAVDKAVLVMPGDIPLATPMEIEAFVDGCDLSRYDYCLGLSAEPTLQAYYPHPGQPGIHMAYFTLRDLQVRQNNLHLVKPLRLGNRHYIQKIYDFRYQREWRNIARLCWELCTTQEGSLQVAGYFVCLHLARYLTLLGWHRVAMLRPFFLDLPLIASVLSQVLRTRFTTVITPYGGCTLDVDNEEHYETICVNFAKWLAHQHTLAQEIKQQS